MIDDHSRLCVASRVFVSTRSPDVVRSSTITTVRPHRSLGRRTPAETFAAGDKSAPRGPMIDAAGYRVRRDKVDTGGTVTLRYRGRLHHIGVGRAYAGWRVIILVAGKDIRVLGIDGSPLRHLTLDPGHDYQPMP